MSSDIGPVPIGSGRPARDLRTLPKAHLHVHLESTIRPSTLATLGGPEAPPSYDGFAAFFAHNDRVRACLRRPADFRRIAVEYCEDEAANGTRYAEVSFSAAAHGDRIGDPAGPLLAVLDGLDEGRERHGIDVRVIIDHSRRRPVERAWRSLDLARRYAATDGGSGTGGSGTGGSGTGGSGTGGVVAVGLAGDEAFPAEPFAEVYAAARAEGVHVVHHAGEACGASSVRAALSAGAERIGHGITVLDDPELVAELRQRRIALEVCPSSNVGLGFAPSLAGHPFPALVAAGLAVTVNTDVPSLVGVSLAEEYRRVRDAYGYDDAAMAGFARAAVDASFAPEATRARLHREITAWLGSGAPVASAPR